MANYDASIGLDDDGSIWKINIQPVIPLSLSEDWNLISRTIIPVNHQEDIPVKGEDETGIGDYSILRKETLNQEGMSK